MALKFWVELLEFPEAGVVMGTLGDKPSTVIVVVTEALRFPAASLAAKVSVQLPSEPQPNEEEEVAAWKIEAVPATNVMEMLVAPLFPETLTEPSSLFASVTLTLIWMICVEETEVSLTLAFNTAGRVVSTVKVTDWELFIWL